MRLNLILQFILLVAIGCGVYHVANEYQIVEKQVRKHEAQSEQERENIRVLQAEWAFLTNPVRMEKIAREHFQLEPSDGTQMVSLMTLPLRAMLDAQQQETLIAGSGGKPVPGNAIKGNAITGNTVASAAQNLPPSVTASAPPVSPAMPRAAALPPLAPLAITPVNGVSHE